MKPRASLHTYLHELHEMRGLSAAQGKPQNLQIVGDTLYWLQGMSQELYALSLVDHEAVPRRVCSGKSDSEANGPDGFVPESKEEELLRERLRSRVTGISSFRVRPSDGTVFYVSGMHLFLYRPAVGGPTLRVFDYITNETKLRYFASGKPFLCIQHLDTEGGDSGIGTITFVCDSNLYMAQIDERETELKVHVEQITDFGNENHECGTADYIIQEEFHRFTGHYAHGRYLIFSYTDTSMLRTVSFIDDNAPRGVSEMSYCRVGDANARTILLVHDLQTRELRIVPPCAIAGVAPWAEYLPRFGFKDNVTLYLSLLSRSQEQACVLSCPIGSLPIIDAKGLAGIAASGGQGLAAVPLALEWEQRIPWAWVEVQPGPPIHFGKTHDLLVCHAAETPTAHCHIFARAKGAGHTEWRPLTSGEWGVAPGTVSVVGDRVLFLANAGSRLGRGLYSVPLAPSGGGPATPKRLTPEGEFVHAFRATRGGHLCYVAGTAKAPVGMFAASLSDPRTRRAVDTQWVEGTADQDGTIAITNKLLILPDIVTITNRRGVKISGKLYVSPAAAAAEPGKPSPLAMLVYGGPHAQLVFEDFYESACQQDIQLLARSGVSVLVADGQMSNANGLRDLSVCKNNMGNFETDDYVDFAQYMSTAKDLPNGFIADPARIAIYGWSYGGYATLLAMSQAAHVFKIGFSGAPVSDWRLYDTGYTERYMGELYDAPNGEAGEDNKSVAPRSIRAAYMNSTIRKFAHGFPDDLNRVFISHGLLDENVHFSHTCEVVKAMIDAGKPYSLLLYPGERHALRQNPTSRLYKDAILAKTLVEQL